MTRQNKINCLRAGMVLIGVCASFLVGVSTAKLLMYFAIKTVSAQVCQSPGPSSATPFHPTFLQQAGKRAH